MYSNTPPVHTDSHSVGNTTNTKSLTCTPLHHQPTLTLSMVAPPVPPQYGNTTSTKSLTCTPLHHQPTLTLSMVTPPVPRV